MLIIVLAIIGEPSHVRKSQTMNLIRSNPITTAKNNKKLDEQLNVENNENFEEWFNLENNENMDGDQNILDKQLFMEDDDQGDQIRLFLWPKMAILGGYF